MTMLEIESIPVLRDNYIHLAHDSASGATAAIDPAQAEPVLEKLAARGWTLSHILITHHHDDHTGGVAALRARTGCRVFGSAREAARLPPLDEQVGEGAAIRLGEWTVSVLDTPGHTLGHVAYWLPEAAVLFPGDTLFSLGCGRLFEGSPEQMWASLKKLRALPGEADVYCAHEYSLSNAAFARSIDPGNDALARRAAEIERLRAEGRPTVPFRLDPDRAANPFLRADEPALQSAMGLPDADPARVFAEIRKRKDVF